MHKRRRPLLIAAVVASLMIGAGVALAQSLGLGMGTDDLFPGKGTGVLPVARAITYQTGLAITYDTGKDLTYQ